MNHCRFSPQSYRGTKALAQKMGLDTGWNSAISLRDPGSRCVLWCRMFFGRSFKLHSLTMLPCLWLLGVGRTSHGDAHAAHLTPDDDRSYSSDTSDDASDQDVVTDAARKRQFVTQVGCGVVCMTTRLVSTYASECVAMASNSLWISGTTKPSYHTGSQRSASTWRMWMMCRCWFPFSLILPPAMCAR